MRNVGRSTDGALDKVCRALGVGKGNGTMARRGVSPAGRHLAQDARVTCRTLTGDRVACDG